LFKLSRLCVPPSVIRKGGIIFGVHGFSRGGTFAFNSGRRSAGEITLSHFRSDGVQRRAGAMLSFWNASKLTLTAALGVARGEVVSLVGGGGKTTAMLRIAEELAAQGQQALISTTTHIFPPDRQQFPALVLERNFARMIAAVREAFSAHPLVIVAPALNDDGRLAGIDPSWVTRLREEFPRTTILVEADGSKGRPFKAPAWHEPVIPPCTHLVVPVVGLSALGQSLSEKAVHRPERVATLAGAHIGDLLTPSLVATVLQHPEGITRGAPAPARVVPLLNQADDVARAEAGRELARELIQRGAGRVVIGAAGQAQPVREVALGSPIDVTDAPVSAIVLAAGMSKRMGQLKLALPLGKKTMLQCVVEAALAACVDEVVVVLGHGAADLEGDLADHIRLRAVYNPRYAEGQSSSVQMGINALHPCAAAGVFLLGDQPLIRPETINALVHAFRQAHPAVAQPVYRGIPGNPVLFSRALFPELLEVTGDQGGRDVLARNRDEVMEVNFDGDLPRDVDTAEDYEKLVSIWQG
jgi:molybdenum cofactor cytidylyltransferase